VTGDGVGGVVEANLDIYGSLARASAVADYLEVAALAGRRITADELADVAEQLNWSRKGRRQIIIEGDDPEETPEGWPEMAFSVIGERIDVLGDDYPFTVRRNALKYVARHRPIDDPYVGVLAIAVVHSWRLPTTVRPTELIEDLAARVLEARSLQVARMGTADRGGVGFIDNLQRSAVSLGLRPSLSPVPRPRSAKDAGVDTLAAVTWKDGRAGQWVMIGQATCAKSNEWRKKLSEPEPNTWRNYLQEALDPLPFLVIPYHIEARHLSWLLSARRGLVLDRLRLVPGKGANSDNDCLLIQAMMAATVQ